jgi:hypothetical protein
MSATYRTAQFIHSLTDRPSLELLEQAQSILGASLYPLFLRMQRADQAHSLRVFSALLDAGYEDVTLLSAALLHDVGKSYCTVNVWERVAAVLVKRFTPALFRRLSAGKPAGICKPFVLAAHHPDWGAKFAASAGAATQLVSLISRHEDKLFVFSDSDEDQLLQILQEYDAKN